MDKNNDGAVTREEFAQAIASGFKPGEDDAQKGVRHERPRHDGPGHPRPHMSPVDRDPHRHEPPSAERLLQKFDTAKKGSLSKEDVPDRLWKVISDADTNKDGVVTKDELETHLKNHPLRGPRPVKPAEKQPQDGTKPQEPKADDPKPQASSNDAIRPADATTVSNG